MKKFILGMAALVASALPAMAAEVALNQQVVNQVITTTSSYVFDLNQYGVDALSASVLISSANPQTMTFTDGAISSGTIKVANNSFLATQASSDTIIVTTTSALAPTKATQSILIASASATALSYSTITINGTSISSGAYTTLGSSNAIATSLAAAINGNYPYLTAAVSPVGGATVTLTCTQAGSFCNAYSLQTSTVALLTSSGTRAGQFSGGNDNASFNLNGSLFTQGQAWAADTSYSSNTAISIMNAINNVTAYTASTVSATNVLVKLTSSGTFGNAYTLTSSTGALKILSATFAGGQDNAYLSINGTVLTAGTDWTVGASSAATAFSIASAINGNTSLSSIITSSAVLSCGAGNCAVVYATGTISLSNNNYQWSSSSEAALTVSTNSVLIPNALLTGTTAGYLINTTSISIPNHGYATGLQVKFSSSTVSIAPLTNQTSYYIIAPDGNTIGLAACSSCALAGQYITLASSSTLGAHTFSLTPLPLAGNAIITWTQSNDGVLYSTATVTASNVTIPINTFASPYTPISYGYDFGNVNYRYLRLNITGPNAAGAGGYNTIVTGYGKRYWR